MQCFLELIQYCEIYYGNINTYQCFITPLINNSKWLKGINTETTVMLVQRLRNFSAAEV